MLVGAGSGLSASAGMADGGSRFQEAFPDFIAKYHYKGFYESSFQRYESPEEYWAYWSRHILLDRYEFEENGVYATLLSLLDGKDYFVITTNVDHCFQKAGIDKKRLYYTQGDYGLWQCSLPCHQRTYDNEAVVRRMVAEQRDMRVPSELIPYCPECGRPMTTNLRVDDRFVQDDGWYEAAERYQKFCRMAMRTDTLFLELGVGYNTPGIIKFPFWDMAAKNKGSRYAAVSLGTADVPDQLRGRGIGIDADIADVIGRVANMPVDRRSLRVGRGRPGPERSDPVLLVPRVPDERGGEQRVVLRPVVDRPCVGHPDLRRRCSHCRFRHPYDAATRTGSPGGLLGLRDEPLVAASPIRHRV